MRSLLIFPLCLLGALAMPCADQSAISGTACHTFIHPNDQLESVLVSEKLHRDNLEPSRLTPRSAEATFDFTPTPKDETHCDSSLLDPSGDPDKPPTDDCDKLGTWARGSLGQWHAAKADFSGGDGAGWVLLATSGSCGLYIAPNGTVPEYGVYVGNTDVADILQDAVQMSGDACGWQGVTGCDTFRIDGDGGEMARTPTRWILRRPLE